ncbi:dual specificity protein phosphatase-like protein [Actinomadura pelletieri DSM 43383]|uniref:Dual specificity protein phosphatase-like protein n=1 Tax=Actinomadura pelletieri DSM 43383 TaxID=1120940 RepID=A0A495QYX3_9ACTN|nr:dual specificity protein phosphatase [Actinomadura pelletieri]RKS79257.1 dual specificity protein phosphatase-like protein [Actinomadura pelletieri DSM 43383]
MRTKGRRVPDAEHPWNEIVPGLWMGGHHYTGASGERAPVIVRDEFDTVISLHRQDGHGPPPHVDHHYEDIPDAPLTAAQLETVCRLADIAVEAVAQGRRVLVRCHSGYNRSGLVIAQSLIRTGYTADDAVFLIRYRRSKQALNNHLFVDYLTSGLDVARLLTGLDSLQ